MAYTVLARRYRSTTFDEVVGQAHIAQTLKRAISSGRIAHAYLFCGTRGTGKTSMARILAKALNCLSSTAATPDPCGKCSSCVGIARGDDMDYIEIDAASNTQVDKTREAIIDNVGYRPALCRYKIFLIDEVHMLSKGSFNALLKTLEEPPEHVKFILATTEAEKIPNTILSRCQRYDFKNISSKEVASHLAKICTDEGIAADADALLMVARAGGGSMRDSLSLLDRLLSVGEKTLTLETIEALLGLPRAEQLAALVDALGTADAGSALRQADAILASGMSPDSLITGLTDYLHNLLLLRVCGDKTDLVEVVGVALDRLRAQAARMDAVVITQDIAVLEELRRQLRTGSGGRALMDATLVRLALAEQFRSISELLSGDEDGSGGGGGAGAEKKKLIEPAREATKEPAPEPTRQSVLTAPQPVAPAPVLSPAAAAPTPPPTEEDDDDLPRPGKVWDNSGPSLSEMLAAKEGKPTPSAAAPTPEPSNIEPVNDAMLPQVWKGVLEGFKRSAPGLLGVLNSATLGSVQDGFAVVSLPSEHQHTARLIEKETNRQRIAASLSEALGQTVGVRVVVEQSVAVAAPPPPAAPQPKFVKPDLREVRARYDAEPPKPLLSPDTSPTPGTTTSVRLTEELLSTLREDELIRSALDTLGGQIVKVTED